MEQRISNNSVDENPDGVLGGVFILYRSKRTKIHYCNQGGKHDLVVNIKTHKTH